MTLVIAGFGERAAVKQRKAGFVCCGVESTHGDEPNLP
jgi:hypothetical protein